MDEKDLKKGQLNIKNESEKVIDTFTSENEKEFKQTTSDISLMLKNFYNQFNLSQETINILQNNPEFAIGITDIKSKTDSQIKSLFHNFRETFGEVATSSYARGFAARVWEAEIQNSIIYDIPVQPLPYVEDLIMNKEIFDFTIGDKITSLTGETLTKVKDSIESSLRIGRPISETTKEIRDIIGYTVEGKRQKGALARANRIAKTETRRAYNTAQNAANEELKDLGVESVEIWRATLDRRTRPYHLAADGQAKGQVEENKFYVGGEECDHPQDSSLSARNSINCRCYVEYTTEPDEPTLRAVRDKEKLPSGRRAMPKNLEDASWKQWRERRLNQLKIKRNFTFEEERNNSV